MTARVVKSLARRFRSTSCRRRRRHHHRHRRRRRTETARNVAMRQDEFKSENCLTSVPALRTYKRLRENADGPGLDDVSH